MDINISISNLELGDQIRGIDETFVKELMKRMLDYPDDSYQSLYVLVNNVDKRSYDQKKVCIYI